MKDKNEEGLPFLTSSMAAIMSDLVYCLYLFHSKRWVGT